MIDNNTDGDVDKKNTNWLSITPQGIATLAIVGIMVVLQRVNPFLKFTRTILSAQRYLYITLFALFIVLVSLLYAYDPFGFVQPYWGIFTPIVIFFGTFLFAVVLWYTLQFTDRDVFQSRQDAKPTPIISFFIKLGILLGSLGMSVALITWIVINVNKLSGSPAYVASLIINVLLTVAILGFVYKILSKSSILQSSPYTRLIVNAILYIPCVFVNIVDFIVNTYYAEKNRTNRSEILISALIIVLFALYFIVPYVIHTVYRKLQGGKLLLNEPVSTTTKTVLANYQELNNIPLDEVDIDYTYNYAISLWSYVNAIPATSRSSTEYTPICDYGGKPTVLYKADTNTLMITVKLKELTPAIISKGNLDVDDYGNVIIYKMEDMMLQKWNNIIINYQGGIMDIFYNGDLVKSVRNIVPYMSLDVLSVGNAKGVNGQVCNVMYYDYALDIDRIKYLYNSVKSSNPPILPYSDTNKTLLK